MVSASKNAKLECRNRVFNNDWTLNYLFISPTMCLLCNECVSAVKEYNMKRHFTTKRADLRNLPEGSAARKSKIESFITSYHLSP